MYEIIFSETGLRQLNKLERQLQERITKVLERTRIRPEVHVKKLVGDAGYSLRVGDYRIIMDVIRKELIIHIIKIDHRKRVYQR